MSSIDDAKEFADITGVDDGSISNNRRQPIASESNKDDSEEIPTPGKTTQYALYRDGYMATTPTVESLPAGCYDVNSDQRGNYAKAVRMKPGYYFHPELFVFRVLDSEGLMHWLHPFSFDWHKSWVKGPVHYGSFEMPALSDFEFIGEL